MSRLTELIGQVKAKSPSLGAELEREYRSLSNRRAFGLNFERHRPEAVELPGRPVRRGDKVRILAPRGSTERGERRLWRVSRIERVEGDRVAHLEALDEDDSEPRTAVADDLVVVAEFRDPIFPGLVPSGGVHRGGDKPVHTVVNGENFHVLHALSYTHRGLVDAIYIDPPYNTGARDWKYNNDYVDSDDDYRHSKWLAMMERRLKLAQVLLNPDDSVLIITIDEKEYQRLGLLLGDLFPDCAIQMVTSVINPKGTPKRDFLARVEEYIYLVYVGSAVPSKTRTRMLSGEELEKPAPVRWASLQRSGGQSLREDTEVKFYPIFLEEDTGRITRIGDHVDQDFDISSVSAPEGEMVQWPIKSDGRHGCWQVSDVRLRDYLQDGRVRVGTKHKQTGRWTLYYLMTSDWDRIQSGEIEVTGRDERGALILSEGIKAQHGKTVWTMTSHSATDHGTAMVKQLTPGRNFPYPKSVYAVEDVLRFFIDRKPSATVVDFFAGSGTTAHAVMRLNRQDGGRRQSILVTNNEVSADEEKALRGRKLRPGDDEWESLGICEYFTKPRIEASVTGRTPDGLRIMGDYKFTDEFPIAEGFEENVEFFTLTYESPLAISHNRAFQRVAPLLWLRAGAEGRRIDKVAKRGWDIADTYGILFDLDYSAAFAQAVEKCERLRLAFIVTDDDRRFQSVARQLSDGVEVVRLYESYMSNFRFTGSES